MLQNLSPAYFPGMTTKGNLNNKTCKECNILVMCVLALLAGIIGGLGAWAFRMLIGLVHNVLFLGEFVFYYDANIHTPSSPWGIWVILVPVAGSLIVAWLVKNFAPEAKGHGVPEVMDAIYYKDGMIRPRVAIVKSIASAISIGSGGAVGREGPIIQIGSAFGSMLGQLVNMSARQRITLIAAGSGAGIAATFNAPLGGIVFAIELLLISVNAVNVMLVAIATVTATHIGRLLLGIDPSFNIPALALPNFQIHLSTELLLFIVLGVLMGLISVVFIRLLYWTEDLFEALPGNYYTRHALGMLCVGIMMYLLLHYTGHYYVQGVGYATIMDILTGVLTQPWLLLLLFVLKLMATCLSLGSGASGGVFSPALFMGATAGSAFGHLALWIFPGLELSIPAFAIGGMAAAIGGSTGAVLTAIVMLTEMTADYNVVTPLIIVVVSATAVRKLLMRESIYTMKLLRRGNVVPEGLQAAITSAKRVSDLMRTNINVVDSGDPAAQNDDVWIITTEETISIPKKISQTANGDRQIKNYILAKKETSFVEAMRIMKAADAEVILVSEFLGDNKASHIIGVLDEQTIANHAEELVALL